MSTRNYLTAAIALISSTLISSQAVFGASPDAHSLYEDGLSRIKNNEWDNARKALNGAYEIDKSNSTADGILACAADLNALSQVELFTGNSERSRRYCLDATALIDKYIAGAFPQLTFSQKCSFQEIAKRQRDEMVTSCAAEQILLPAAYSYMLKWKGLLLESLRQQKTALARDPIAAYDTDKLRALLKPDEAFIDIVRFTPYDDNKSGYGAIVFKAGENGQPKWFYIVDASLAEDIICTWRAMVTKDQRELANSPFRKNKPSLERENISAPLVASSVGSPGKRDIEVEQPTPPNFPQRNEKRAREILALMLINKPSLKEFLGPNITKLWICPEGEFAKIPWNSVAYSVNGGALKVCAVDSPREFVILKTAKTKVNQNSSVLLAGLSKFNAPLSNLNGALEEVESLKPLADRYDNSQTKMLIENDATKESVRKALQTVSIAHIATHGFATGNSNANASTNTNRSTEMKNTRHAGSTELLKRVGNTIQFLPTAENPLLECGLYFASPKNSRADEPGNSNILTAQEIVGLNLSQCDLVTLSACQSGMGHDFNGQGIIGLRSAIMSAGAKSMLMSMWSVPDDATKELMQHFYTYLWRDKLSKAEALAKAQQDIRTDKKHDWSDPQYWAAWELTGDGFDTAK